MPFFGTQEVPPHFSELRKVARWPTNNHLTVANEKEVQVDKRSGRLGAGLGAFEDSTWETGG